MKAKSLRAYQVTFKDDSHTRQTKWLKATTKTDAEAKAKEQFNALEITNCYRHRISAMPTV